MHAGRLAILSSILASALLAACGARDAEAPVRAATPVHPVIVQGAMDIEIRKLAGAIDHAQEEKVKGWTFWRGEVDGYPVVVSKTLKGMENAAAATVLAAERYEPIAIINQGTAGGHQPDLHVFDIVVGTDAVNLGSFKTGFRERGRGSSFDEWLPLDLMRSEGSAGNDPNARTMRRFHADDGLLAAARSVRDRYQKGRVVDGVIGSSEVWNSELDRVQQFHDRFGTTAEEMETASAAQIAAQFEIPFLGVRVVSNNITNGGAYDPATGAACQAYVLEVIKAYVAAQRTRSTQKR
ncbi:MAG TPA: 5'-methylthioadenosine/S-adenosylhomocysteine nucleosidase [Vicinamibacterales bacterium]|nr:5'-methylthioadenosine/S-adenosylhomocysteine nucleosidase [Vicinamibacterales bacterium]